MKGSDILKPIKDLLKLAFTQVDKSGYRKVRIVDIPIHRIAGTIKQGRLLLPGEVVHHKNENKLDNRLSNLQVFKNQSAHMKHHWKQRKRKRKKR